MRVHLYGRVSTDHQDNSAKSQRLRLEDWCAKQGHEPAGCYIDEDVSGGVALRLRPQGSLLCEAVKPGEAVAFTKVDRCFRSVADAASVISDWRERGINVIIIDLGIDVTTPAGELFFNQLACFAQFERAMISQRVRECWAYLREQGRPYGTARPMGWCKRRGVFVPLPEERAIGMRALEQREAGRSYRDIYMWLRLNHMHKPLLVVHSRQGKRTKGYYHPGEVVELISAAAAGFPKILPAAGLDPVPARRRRGQRSRAYRQAAAAAADQQIGQ